MDSLKKLSKEAKKLIMEYSKVESLIGDGWINSVIVSKDGLTLDVEDKNGEVTSYDLSEVTSIFSYAFGDYGAFDEEIACALQETEDNFKEMTKAEFIKKSGEIIYTKCKCEEIYERLEEIENEVNELM